MSSPGEENMAAVELRIRQYEDIAVMEREVCRLLHCEDHRTPVHANTVSYFRFRSKIIQLLSYILDKENHDTPLAEQLCSFKMYLPQGLLVKCCADEGFTCIVASIGWVRGSCVYEEGQGKHVSMEGADVASRSEGKKRERACGRDSCNLALQGARAKKLR
jgi:hypothetical protein